MGSKPMSLSLAVFFFFSGERLKKSTTTTRHLALFSNCSPFSVGGDHIYYFTKPHERHRRTNPEPSREKMTSNFCNCSSSVDTTLHFRIHTYAYK